ncbi:hypothetical protein JNL27_17165 [bacterium]|nr:hypothetical protein [bacterium]
MTRFLMISLLMLFFVSCDNKDENEMTPGEQTAQYLQEQLTANSNPWIQPYVNGNPVEWTGTYHFEGEFLYTDDHYYNLNHLVYFWMTTEGVTPTMKLYFTAN